MSYRHSVLRTNMTFGRLPVTNSSILISVITIVPRMIRPVLCKMQKDILIIKTRMAYASIAKINCIYNKNQKCYDEKNIFFSAIIHGRHGIRYMAVPSIVPFVFCSSQQKMDKVFISYEGKEIRLSLFINIDIDRNPYFCSELLSERSYSVNLYG